jgi:hypothetical protein
MMRNSQRSTENLKILAGEFGRDLLWRQAVKAGGVTAPRRIADVPY